MIACLTVDLGPGEYVPFDAAPGPLVVRVDSDSVYLAPFEDDLVSRGSFSTLNREPPSAEGSYCVAVGDVLSVTLASPGRFLVWRSPSKESTIRVSLLYEVRK